VDVAIKGPAPEQALQAFVVLVLSDCLELSESPVYFLEELALVDPPSVAAMAGGERRARVGLGLLGCSACEGRMWWRGLVVPPPVAAVAGGAVVRARLAARHVGHAAALIGVAGESLLAAADWLERPPLRRQQGAQAHRVPLPPGM
jgi:hypothetical protein